ncbi:hypothetical protein Acy02nite_90910 [Actinoplanes cyaneus]|uniref:Uncharacterized protein n=1 Tax=Actinoplanes cyaneus TaxID=52696 RepID=A0A919M669_9ACTN|nr:hypothetical protein Acy02nite_90910 [Actinoplanes cyaneus]
MIDSGASRTVTTGPAWITAKLTPPPKKRCTMLDDKRRALAEIEDICVPAWTVHDRYGDSGKS